MRIHELITAPSPNGTVASSPVRGIVAVAPVSADEPLLVKRPDVTHDVLLQCVWEPKGTAFPDAGANCLVVFDNTGAPYVVWWEGAGSYGGSSAIFARKTADETQTDSFFSGPDVILQDDAHLVVSVAANSVYTVDGALIRADNPELYFGFAAPAGATFNWGTSWPTGNPDPSAGATAQFVRTLTDQAYILGPLSSGQVFWVPFRGLLRTVSSGQFKLQWAYDWGAPDTLTLKADSYMHLTKVA